MKKEILLFILLITISFAANECYYSNGTFLTMAKSGITINPDESLTCNDTAILSEAYFEVNSGNLTFENFNLTFKMTGDGTHGIDVYNGSRINIQNSNITSNDSSYQYYFYNENSEELIINNSRVEQCGYGSAMGGRGLEIYNISTVIISNLTFQSSRYLFAENLTNITIENSDIKAIDAYRVNNSLFSNNHVGTAVLKGLAFTYSQNNTVIDNVIDATDTCLRFDHGQGYNTVLRNTLNSGAVSEGIYLFNNSHNILGFNTMNNGMLSGLAMYLSTNNTIENNTMDDAGDGINARDSWDNSFWNNTIMNQTNYGIYLRNVTGNTFTNTHIINSGWWDYYTFDHSENTVVNMTFNDTSASFTSANISIRNRNNPPGKENNASSYLNITNNSVDAWMYLNLSYTDTNVENLTESSLKLWRHDGSSWGELASTLDSVNNYVYYNVTNFSVFGIFGTVLSTVTGAVGDVVIIRLYEGNSREYNMGQPYLVTRVNITAANDIYSPWVRVNYLEEEPNKDTRITFDFDKSIRINETSLSNAKIYFRIEKNWTLTPEEITLTKNNKEIETNFENCDEEYCYYNSNTNNLENEFSITLKQIEIPVVEEPIVEEPEEQPVIQEEPKDYTILIVIIGLFLMLSYTLIKYKYK